MTRCGRAVGGARAWRRFAAIAAALAFSLGEPALAGDTERADVRSRPDRDLPAEVAVTAQASPAEEPNRAVEESEAIVYHPPRRGSPRSKVGGGVRGTRALPRPLALAPDHVAHTVSAAPSLFWHIDDAPAANARLLFTLIDEESIDPIAEFELPRPKTPGIYRVRLAEHGVKLVRGVEYEWSISLVASDDQRARDAITTGSLLRVDEPALGGRDRDARTFADLGLWYDALESISDDIDAQPGNWSLREQRNSLLGQAQLDAAIQ